jgi:membrane protease YdiL (CAAX protease family)
MLPLVWIATSQQSFILKYPLLERARSSWKIFFIFELATILYLFAWEFIWRGFMLFGLKQKFGIYSIFIQMIPFVILHNGKPSSETFGAIIGGLLLGMLAFRTKSIYYCVISHAGIMFSIDLISTLRYRTDEFGIGIISFVNILKHIL